MYMGNQELRRCLFFIATADFNEFRKLLWAFYRLKRCNQSSTVYSMFAVPFFVCMSHKCIFSLQTDLLRIPVPFPQCSSVNGKYFLICPIAPWQILGMFSVKEFVYFYLVDDQTVDDTLKNTSDLANDLFGKLIIVEHKRVQKTLLRYPKADPQECKRPLSTHIRISTFMSLYN